MADCWPWDLKCQAGDVLENASQGVFADLEKWLSGGAVKALKWSVTAWIQVDTPQVDQADGPAAYIQAYTTPIAYVIMLCALMLTAARVAWTGRGEELADMGRQLVTFISISLLGAGVVAALTIAGDGYARWIIDASLGLGPNASDTQLQERIVAAMGAAKLMPETAGGAAILVGPILALAAACMLASSIVQIFFSFLRSVSLLLLVGGLPVAAAAGMTRSGREMLGRYLAWLLAWVLLKPAAATIYAAGFWMIGVGGALDVLGGIALLVMAVLALGALLRLLVPASAALASAGGGAAGAAMGSAAAMGAVQLAGKMGGGAGGGSLDASGMSVRDASDGSTPTGSTSGGSAGGGTTGAAATEAGAEGAAAGGAAAGETAGAAGAAAGGAGTAAGGAGSAASGAGVAAGGAAAGAATAGVGLVAVGVAKVAMDGVQAGSDAAKGAAGAATGENN